MLFFQGLFIFIKINKKNNSLDAHYFYGQQKAMLLVKELSTKRNVQKLLTSPLYCYPIQKHPPLVIWDNTVL